MSFSISFCYDFFPSSYFCPFSCPGYAFSPSFLSTLNSYIKLALGNKEAAVSDYDTVKKDRFYLSVWSDALPSKQKESSCYKLYKNSGDANFALGKNNEAISDYDKLIGFYSNNSELYLVRGEAKSALGKNDDAISDYNKAIKLNPALSYAYYLRGDAKSALDKKRGARADYQKAAELYLEEGNNEWHQKSLEAIKTLGI